MLRTFRSGWARALAALLPIVLAALILWLPERLRRPEPVHTEWSAQAAGTKLLVVLVDSLAARDVSAATMPRLAAQLEREGLHGPVRACADAVTVPCLLAMVRGSDHLSVFALERNFGGGERALEGSILGELAARGLRIGYFGEAQLARPLRGVHIVETERRSDREILLRARTQLESARLNLSIAHLLELDDTSHLHGADSERYRGALEALDAQLATLLASVPRSTHVVVLGDHGHTSDGRHAAGLDTTTYAAYFGPHFRSPRHVPMAITDHAAIWARLFGARRSDEAARVDSLFSGRLQSASADAPLPPLREDPGPPRWYALLVFAVAVPIAFGAADLFALRRFPIRAAAACLLVLVWALAFTLGWPALRSREPLLLAPLFVASCGLGFTLRRYLAPGGLLKTSAIVSAADPPQPLAHPGGSAGVRTCALLGALVFAPPVLALAGGPRFALAVAIAVLLERALHGRSTGAFWPLVTMAALLSTLFPGALAADVPTRFAAHARAADALGLWLPAALLFSAVALVARRAQRMRLLLLLAVGCALALALARAPARLQMVPCVVALPLTLLALRRRALFGALCVVLPAALLIFFEQSAEQLSPLLTVVAVASLAPRSANGQEPEGEGVPQPPALTRAALLLLMVWLSYWTTLGARLGGVDFDFYFAFLPADATATSEWPLTALLTTAKYLLTSALPLLFASQRAAIPRFTFDLAAALGRMRLAFVCVLMAFAWLLRMVPSSWLLGELMQEAALFALLLLTLGALGASLPETAEGARAY